MLGEIRRPTMCVMRDPPSIRLDSTYRRPQENDEAPRGRTSDASKVPRPDNLRQTDRQAKSLAAPGVVRRFLSSFLHFFSLL